METDHRIADATVIWRYMALEKFLALLVDRELFFSPLGRLEDPWEGAINPRNLTAGNQDELQVLLRQRYQEWRQNVYVNCWHKNVRQDMSMWKVYGDRGVAVRSSVGRLRNALRPDGSMEVEIGHVEYFAVDSLVRHKVAREVGLPFVKHNSYRYEREIRAAVLNLSPLVNYPTAPRPVYPSGGFGIAVDLEELIGSIYVLPLYPERFHRVVTAVAAQFGLKQPVIYSRLLAAPSWIAGSDGD